MTPLPAPLALDPKLIAGLTAELATHELSLSRSRGRLFSRVSPPDALFEGESYQVDLSVPQFQGIYEGEVVTVGPAQLIGTYSQPRAGGDGSFLWGFENPEPPPTAWDQLKPIIDGLPALAGVRAIPRFFADEDLVESLATFVAVQGGWLGAYPATVGKATAYLAVRLLRAAKDPAAKPTAQPWCTLCGRYANQVKILIAGPEEVYLCNQCLADAEGIGEGRDLSNDPDGFAPEMVACMLCERKRTRIFFPYTALCHACVRMVRDSLTAAKA
jgi:hypothetical protein